MGGHVGTLTCYGALWIAVSLLLLLMDGYSNVIPSGRVTSSLRSSNQCFNVIEHNSIWMYSRNCNRPYRHQQHFYTLMTVTTTALQTSTTLLHTHDSHNHGPTDINTFTHSSQSQKQPYRQGLPFEVIDRSIALLNRSPKRPPGDRIFDRLLTGASPQEISVVWCDYYQIALNLAKNNRLLALYIFQLDNKNTWADSAINSQPSQALSGVWWMR